jgi:hypothetical protein
MKYPTTKSSVNVLTTHGYCIGSILTNDRFDENKEKRFNEISILDR